MKTLEHQLADYGDRQRELHGPITPAELTARRSPLTSTPRDVDEPTVDYLQQPDETLRPTRQRRWIDAAVAIAAAILLIVGVVAVAHDDSHDTTTDSSASPSAPGPVSEYQWSRVNLDVEAMGGVDASIHSVTAGGPGLVAVGSVGPVLESDAAVWTSVDGITWTRVRHDPEIFGGDGIQSMDDITVGGPGLVAVGRASSSDGSDTYAVAAVWTSTDGITWTRVPHDPEVFGGSSSQPSDVAEMAAVTAGGPGLVAVGEVGFGRDMAGLTGEWGPFPVAAVWTSPDGTHWSRVPHDPEIFGDWDDYQDEVYSFVSDVSEGGPGLVAVGSAVWTSVDGLSWSRINDHSVTGGFGMSAVTRGGPGLVAVGSGSETQIRSQAMETWTAVVWTSTDGSTWTRVPHDEENLGGPGLQLMWDVTTTERGLVAVGSGSIRRESSVTGNPISSEVPAVWTSADGINWSLVPYDEELFGTDWMAGVTAGGPGLVAVGSQVTVGAGGFKSGGGPAIWVATTTD